MPESEEEYPCCPECDGELVERLETKYYTNYLCHNPDCDIIVFSD